MNPKISGIGILFILGVLVFHSTGCGLFLGAGAVGATAGTTVYLNGEEYSAYSVPMEKVWKASEDVIAEMEMKVTRKSIDNMDRNRFLKGKMKDGKDFEISLEAKAPDVTVVKVRVGIFGDETGSKKIQDAIAQKIKG
jgi:Protein of unknown function (DUF3568)